MAATKPFTTIPEALKMIHDGGMLIITDDESRENEGDLFIAAQRVTPQGMTYMMRQACGLTCLTLTGAQLDRLGIPLQVPERAQDMSEPGYSVLIDAASGITTGASAFDLAHTVRVASDPASWPEMLVRPGHVIPLRARDGGVLVRQGHTEASVDLARLANLWPAGVIAMMVDENGEMRRLPGLQEFGQAHHIPIITIADLIDYRRKINT